MLAGFALARSATLRTRRYQPGDERQILRLFRLAFRQRKSLGRWRWEFLDTPCVKASITVLVDDKARIVGHYGAIPVRFNCQETVIAASQIVDFMIHPGYRGRAAVERLVHAHIQHSRDDRIGFLYGFNDIVVARSHRRFFGADLVPVGEWVHDIPQAHDGLTSAQDDPAVSPGARLDDQIDALWERVRTGYPYAVVRDSRYLKWRYSRRSDRRYLFSLAKNPSSGELAGLAVLGGTRADGLILELLTDPDDARSMTALLRASVAIFSPARKRRVRAWLPACGLLRQCAQATGFRATEPRFHLNLFRLDDSLNAAALARGFYYSLGDYDVY